MKLWLNGVVQEAGIARIDPADRGLTLGDGVFETIRAAEFAPARLGAHWRRLCAGAALLGLPAPPGQDALAVAIGQVLRENAMPEAAVRITYTRGTATSGTAPRGVLPPAACQPTLLITCAPLPGPARALRAMLCQTTRRNEASPLSRIKSLNYLDSILARQEAAARGFDEAILLNTLGRVSEASAANLFVMLGGQLVTPPVEDGALPGVMRQVVIEQFDAATRSLEPADLARAEAAFITTALGVRLLSQLDDAWLDQGHARVRAIADWAAKPKFVEPAPNLLK
jgi:branched-chain amino acid aminotransferase